MKDTEKIMNALREVRARGTPALVITNVLASAYYHSDLVERGIIKAPYPDPNLDERIKELIGEKQ